MEGYFDIYRTGTNNRPFYRYSSHIELIGFKEYYGMPRGHVDDPVYLHQYLRGQFFFKFPKKKIVMGKKDRCAVFGYNEDRLFPQKYTLEFPFCPKSTHKYRASAP